MLVIAIMWGPRIYPKSRFLGPASCMSRGTISGLPHTTLLMHTPTNVYKDDPSTADTHQF